MKTFDLKGEIRTDFGKKAAAQLRSKNLIPCIVYGGKDSENINFTVETTDVFKLIYTPEVFIVNLTLGDIQTKAIVKEIQFHPVKEQILHMDFLPVTDNAPVEVKIPVNLVGLAPGVKAGGKLYLDIRRLRAKGIYHDFPEVLTIDVSKLKLGDSIQVSELDFDNIEILNPKDAVVCRVQTTRMIADPTLEEEEEDAEESEEEGAEEEASEENEE